MAREKIITIGGTGLVGSVLIPYLRQHFDVSDWSVDSIHPADRLDLTDTSEFINKIRSNSDHVLAIVNLAAATDTNRAFTDLGYQVLCRHLNHLAPRNAAEFCHTINLPFLHVSTDFVYDGKKAIPGSYLETDRPHPIEPYGASKLDGEIAVLQSGGTVLTLAFPFVEDPLRPDLVQKFYQKLSQNQPIYAFSDQVITPTYIPDFAEITCRLLKTLVRQPDILRGEKFHCVGSSFESPHRVAILIADHFGIDSSMVSETSLLKYNQSARKNSLREYQVNLALSNIKVRRAINFYPMTFEEALVQFPNQSI